MNHAATHALIAARHSLMEIRDELELLADNSRTGFGTHQRFVLQACTGSLTVVVVTLGHMVTGQDWSSTDPTRPRPSIQPSQSPLTP